MVENTRAFQSRTDLSKRLEPVDLELTQDRVEFGGDDRPDHGLCLNLPLVSELISNLSDTLKW